MDRSVVFIIIVVSLVLCQAVISCVQYLRYDYDDYNCVGMSRDTESFLESLGIRVWLVRGARYNNDEPRSIRDAHQWVLIDLGFVAVPFESTLLLFFDPLWLDYEDLRISPGYIVDGKTVDTPLWKAWI